jgi:ribosome-associated heat shock protein Hsp15
MTEGGLRLDKWLYHARFHQAAGPGGGAVRRRRIRLNDRLVEKVHSTVRPGDVITLVVPSGVAVLKVGPWASGRAGGRRRRRSTRRSPEYRRAWRPGAEDGAADADLGGAEADRVGVVVSLMPMLTWLRPFSPGEPGEEGRVHGDVLVGRRIAMGLERRARGSRDRSGRSRRLPPA